VAFESGELTLHFFSPKYVAKLALEQEGGASRDEVQCGPHPDEYQDCGEHARAVRVDSDFLAISDGRQGDRRHEEGPYEARVWIDDGETHDTHEGHQENER
jgi:hypothetical protein